MAERTPAQKATLARLIVDLHGTNVDTTLTPTGELIASLRAIGHQFTFHVNHRGRIMQRSCDSRHFGVLSQAELRVLGMLASRELAYQPGSRHLDPEVDGADVMQTLAGAEGKLAEAVQHGEYLTDSEHRELAQALIDYEASIHERDDEDPRAAERCAHIEEIERKLGVRR